MNESTLRFTPAIGHATLELWPDLPHNVQERLFEYAATFGDNLRHALAVYLHDSIHARAIRPSRPRSPKNLPCASSRLGVSSRMRAGSSSEPTYLSNSSSYLLLTGAPRPIVMDRHIFKFADEPIAFEMIPAIDDNRSWGARHTIGRFGNRTRGSNPVRNKQPPPQRSFDPGCKLLAFYNSLDADQKEKFDRFRSRRDRE